MLQANDFYAYLNLEVNATEVEVTKHLQQKKHGEFLLNNGCQDPSCVDIYIYIHNNVHSMELFLFVVLEFWTPISSRISSEKIDPNWWLGIWNWWTREILHWDFAVESWGLQKIWSGVWGTARVSFHFHDGKKLYRPRNSEGQSIHVWYMFTYIYHANQEMVGRYIIFGSFGISTD